MQELKEITQLCKSTIYSNKIFWKKKCDILVVHKMEYYTAIGKKEFLPLGRMWMKLRTLR